MADKSIQLRIANRAIAIWWLLVLIGLVTYLLPGLWATALDLSGMTTADWALIQLTGAGVGVVGLLRALHLKLSARYTVTPDAVTVRQGLFAQKIDHVQSRHIRSINVTRTLIGRILGYGDIGFSSAGSNRIEVLFRGVANPLGLKDRIAESLSANLGRKGHQDRKGGHERSSSGRTKHGGKARRGA